MNQVIWKLENSDKKLRLGEIIGEGATATVLLANDMDDESIKYAVKRFNKSEMNAYDIADYKREALILKKLAGHPNIVKFIDSFEAAQHYYLLLEYCETDLFDSIFLKCGLPTNDVKKLFSDITAGIDYCHRNEIYHRDIKVNH
jgi:serine/threonine protein kinase